MSRTYRDGITKHPLEVAGATVVIITVIAGYLVGGAWGVKALMDAQLPVLAFILLLILLVFAGAVAAGSGAHIREQYIVRKDCS